MKSEFRRIDPASARIVLFDAAPRIFGMFSEKLSAAATELLNDLERAILQKVRTFMESKVAPVINEHWPEDSFPVDLVPGFRDLQVAGAGYLRIRMRGRQHSSRRVCRDGDATVFGVYSGFQNKSFLSRLYRYERKRMRVALMIPCYIDTFYLRVGIATLELLERLKVDVVYPTEQTCCGQPMANSGCYNEARATEEHFMTVFRGFDYIVTPSGSCTHHVRNKFTAIPDSPERRKISTSIYDLVELLHDVLEIRQFPWASFEHKIALHTSCSAIRGLRMASMSERVHDPKFSKPRTLLEGVRGIEFADFERVDECCGFGGTFSVTEEAVAAKMGYDKIRFMADGGARFIVSSDMSCLMHLDGCARRLNHDVTFLHIAEILNGVSA